MERVDSQHLRELAEDSKPQDLSDEPDEDSKLTDLTEQHEDSISQDPSEQSVGGIQIRLETSEEQPSEEREDSRTPISGSWGKTSTDRVDDTSSFLAPEPSTSSHCSFLSLDTRFEDTQDLSWKEDSQKIPEWLECEELPLSLWEKTRTEWKFERPGHPTPKHKPSFHSHCCNSAIEEAIKHSPWKLTKSSCLRGYIQERRAPGFKRSETISPHERMQKQRIPGGLQRKKERKGKTRLHMAGFCEGSANYLGRRKLEIRQETLTQTSPARTSKALYNLYTTFCDEKEEVDPDFLEKAEGSSASAASGLSRACAIFRVLKKGRINVSNLLLTLHTMGILVTRADMHQALKDIIVDERGNLNFLDFLNVVSLTIPCAGTKALQKARQVFRKLKKDMVAVEDLDLMLACLGVTLNPMIIKQALEYVQITWDWKLNISDFLSTVRRLQSCDKMEYLGEYLTLNWRSFGDANDMDYSEIKQRRKSSLDREMPAHRSPMLMFCSAEEAIAFTELQRQKNKPQRPMDLKRPSSPSPICPAEENKKKHIIKWPKAHLGYSSQDTLFPLESTLCCKEPECAPVQQAETKEAENQSSKDSSLFPRPNATPKVNQTKKKRLSFSQELPKRYCAEDSQVPVFAQLEMGAERSREDPSVQQPFQ